MQSFWECNLEFLRYSMNGTLGLTRDSFIGVVVAQNQQGALN